MDTLSWSFSGIRGYALTKGAMKELLHMCGIVATAFAATVFAADRTWDGDGVDADWTTPANWDGDATAPVAGDALIFGGATKLTNTNTLVAGTSFTGLTFASGAGTFSLWGAGLTLDGNISNLSTSAQTLNLPLALSGDRMIYGSNAAITVNGVLSGPGGLTANITNSVLTLTGANTYEGNTLVTNGQLAVTHKDALGSTNAGTRVHGPSNASLKLSGGIEIAEPIILDGARPSYQSSLISDVGTNTISGLLSKVSTNPRIRVESGAKTLILAGGVTNVSGTGNLGLNPQSGSKLIITNSPLRLGTSTGIQSEYRGTVIYAVPGNTYGSMLICDHNVVRTDVADALSPTAQITIGGSWVADGLLDLNGFDQTIGNLKTDGNKTTPGYLAVTSTVPATLTVNQSGTTTFAGALDGMVSLAKKGTGTLTFSNVMSQTTGDLLVHSGTVAVAETGGFANLQNVRIYGGTLALRNGTALPDAAAVWIASGTTINLAADVNETVGYLYFDDVPRPVGTYGSTASSAQHQDDVHFSGSGMLTVLHSTIVGTIFCLQ